MRRFFVILVAVWSFATPATAAALRGSDLTSAEAVLRWINAYRAKPDIAGVPAAVRALSQFGAFKDPEAAGVYVGFIAGIVGTHPDAARELVGRLFPLPAQDHWVVVRAIAYSGLHDWKDVLRETADRMPTRRVMIEKFLQGKLPTLEHLAFKEKSGWFETVRLYVSADGYYAGNKEKPPLLEPSPDLLDTLWGFYFATGHYRPIRQIIAMLPWSKDNDSLEKLTLGLMAKYTLASNAARDADLLRLLKTARGRQSKQVAAILKDVIDAAETVDTARIRREALAALEELKRKGPGFQRDVAWWGKIGQGALSIGCIGAAVTGHVELGLPCVLGGALSSAALNVWGTQQ